MAFQTFVVLAMLTHLLCCVASVVEARPSPPLFSILDSEDAPHRVRKLSTLVSSPLILPYHSGPLLSGSSSLRAYVVWYGSFSSAQRSTIGDFFASFQESPEDHPSVNSWWKLTAGYKDALNSGVMTTVQLGGEVSDSDYSLGRKLKMCDIESLVLKSLATFPTDSKAVYVVLTSDAVYVDEFCRSRCASHFFTSPALITKGQQLPYAWIGNSATQCPGQCAWPFALPQYGPQGAKALIPPNADVGVDGMIINIASMLAGTATDPFISGYYQGDAALPLEAATACTGIYGEGAYPGYPGHLLVETISGASYNAEGVNDRKYLLPALWDPSTLSCTPLF